MVSGQKANRQSATLQECFYQHRDEVQWLAFIDVDEFIVPRNLDLTKPSMDKLSTILEPYSSYVGLVLPWRTFGPVFDDELIHPRLYSITNATVYDERKGLIEKMSGTIKVIVNTNHPHSIHCNFLQNGGYKKDIRFVHFSHNCLYHSPSPPVDVLFREATDPWMLQYPASGDVIQLNHYFIRSCQHFFDKRRARLVSIKARYGNVIPKWFESRVGIGLGDTDEEICKNLRGFFNTTDTAIVPLATKLWETLDASHKKRWNPPRRPSCSSCHTNSTCVDVLTGTVECTCLAPLVGDGKTYCNEIVWAKAVLSPNAEKLSYVLGSPDGDKYDDHWKTDEPTPTDLDLSFSDDDDLVEDVRRITIFMPFGVQFLDKVKYGVKHHTTSKKVHWHPIHEVPLPDADPFYASIELAEPIKLNYLQITTFPNSKVPAKIGAVGIVSTSTVGTIPVTIN